MAEKTEAQRAARRAYMKKYTARKRKEALAVARDNEIVEMVHANVADKNSALVKARAALAEKRAAARRPKSRLAYMIPRLVDLTLALRKAGCRMAICTFTDGSKITLR